MTGDKFEPRVRVRVIRGPRDVGLEGEVVRVLEFGFNTKRVQVQLDAVARADNGFTDYPPSCLRVLDVIERIARIEP